MFEAVNRLEKLMQAAASDPTKIPDFYRALLVSELYILTPEAEWSQGGADRSNPTKKSTSQLSSSKARNGIPRSLRQSASLSI